MPLLGCFKGIERIKVMKKVNIIAEIGSVHDGSFGNALKLIDLCAEIGVDTVKFQTHIASAETTRDAPSPSYFKAESRFEYFERTAFSKNQWSEIKNKAHSLGMRFMSSPFSEEAVELLQEVGVDVYKIASGEVTNLPMLRKIARAGKAVILSSGMSTWDELDAAFEVLKDVPELMVMQCSSAYPCPAEKVGLNIIKEMADRYKVPIGFSDHTDGIAAALAAVTLGAEAVEKHLTFSKKMYGSDAPNATEPGEFAQMVNCIRQLEVMLSCPVDKKDASSYKDMKDIFEKSIVASSKIVKGEKITLEKLAVKKPGTGIPSSDIEKIIGKMAKRDLEGDHILQWSDLV
jgi:N,N'-diacetyllegionaminate synthase